MADKKPEETKAVAISQLQNIKALLRKGSKEITAAIPQSMAKHMTPERMIRLAATACAKSPRLLQCDPISIMSAVIEASALALEIDGILGHGYLVPRWSTKAGKYMANFQAGYQGLLLLAHRTGNVESVDAEPVYEGDEFVYEKGLHDDLKHVPIATDMTPEKLTHAWALVRFRGGGYQFKVLTKAQVDLARKRSESPDKGPWATDYAAMAVKTAMRRLLKLVPMSSVAARQINKSEMLEMDPNLDPKELETTGSINIEASFLDQDDEDKDTPDNSSAKELPEKTGEDQSRSDTVSDKLKGRARNGSRRRTATKEEGDPT